MTLITFQDGSPVMRDGKVGTEAACCCEKNCCAASEFADCTLEVLRLTPGGNVLLTSGPASSYFEETIDGDCRFVFQTADENPNGTVFCVIDGTPNFSITSCGDCEDAGGECVDCCDSPRIIALIENNGSGQCVLSAQFTEDCNYDATAPYGPCHGYQMTLDCNPLP